MSSVLERSWYQKHWLNRALSPLSWLFGLVSKTRRKLHTRSAQQLPVPVIVVGNISVGGTGKTPLLITLVKRLQAAGYRPGVISRGYGGKADSYPMLVTAESPAAKAGDEPVLIASQAGCPVVVDPDRQSAAMYLLTHSDCNIVLSDDGLQHYRLARDIEIVVVDGERGFGNGRLLPAGPLREPVERLRQADFVVMNGENRCGLVAPFDTMTLAPAAELRSLDGSQTMTVRDWPFTRREINAVAGIGNPQRFADTLSKQGFVVQLHPKPDHHKFTATDIQFDDDKAVFVTAKDAVKCREFASGNEWVLDVTAQLPQPWFDRLLEKIATVKDAQKKGKRS